MFDYRLTVAAQLSHREPLAYSVATRTVPTFVSQFTNPRPPAQMGQSDMSSREIDIEQHEVSGAGSRTRPQSALTAAGIPLVTNC